MMSFLRNLFRKNNRAMEITVETVTGQTFTLQVNSSNTIEQLKSKIREKAGFFPDDQMGLFFNGKQLKDRLKLSHYHIKDGACLHLAFACLNAWRNYLKMLNGMSVYVKTPMGETIRLQVMPYDTIEHVKAMISRHKDGFPISDQNLVFLGQKLENESTLASSKVRNKDIIQLAYKVKEPCLTCMYLCKPCRLHCLCENHAFC